MQRVFDESLESKWKNCRLIGFINKILCYVSIVINVILLIAILAMEVPDCKSNFKQCNDEKATELIIMKWILPIIVCLILGMLIRLISVNNYLRSKNMPTDGKKVKVWLRYYYILLVLSVIGFIRSLAKRSPDEACGHLISTIVIAVEVYIVGQFNKAYFNSAPVLYV